MLNSIAHGLALAVLAGAPAYIGVVLIGFLLQRWRNRNDTF